MSLTSLADAPRLPTSINAVAGFKHNRSRHASSLSKDHDLIDALFMDEGILGDKMYIDEQKIASYKDQCSTKRSLDTKNNILSSDMRTEKNLSFPSTVIQSNPLNGESTKTLELAKQNAGSFLKIKDPNDVLADFLAESSSGIDVNDGELLQVKESRSSLSTKDGRTSLVLTKEEKWDEMDDLLSLLDESKEEDNGADHSLSELEAAAIYSSSLKEDSDFGEYLPSCLSKPGHSAEPNRFASLKTLDQKKEISVNAKQEVSVLKSTAEDISNKGVTNIKGKRSQDCQSTETKNVVPDVLPVLPSAKQEISVSENTAEDISFKGFTNIKGKRSQDCQSTETKNVVPHVLPILPSESKGNSAHGSSESHEEIKRLKDENTTLWEEIMKIETENLKLQKDLFEKESYYIEQLSKKSSKEKEEAQQIADELTSQLVGLKQSLRMTEEKIELIKKMHLQEVEMLKNAQKVELEAKDRQLQSQMTLLEERRSTMESFTQLQAKADQWSSKMNQLEKNLITLREAEAIGKPEWIANIETMVAEQETFLQMLEKRSTNICNQLEKVIILLEDSKRGTNSKGYHTLRENETEKEEDATQTAQGIPKNENSSLQGQQIEGMHDMPSDERQNMLEKFLEFQEQKNLEAERQVVIHMKERISEADAALKKELLEHGIRMRMEAEDMARQKQELEQAKNIAAEIAVEVESSRRELENYRAVFGRISPEARPRELQLDDPFWISTRRRLVGCFDGAAAGMSRWNKPQSRSTALRSTVDEAFQPGHVSYEDQEQDTYYIKDQEQFLVQAERALQEMLLSSMM